MSPMCCAGADSNDLAIYQGDDYLGVVTVYDASTRPPSAADLTGYIAKAQLRRNIADEDPIVAAEIICTITQPNTITLSIPHDVTKNLSGVYMWDLELISDTGVIETILAGNAPVTPEVTRAAPFQLKNIELVSV